jgi:hypothetical protein
MIFGSRKTIPIGTILVPDENEYDYSGVTDENGIEHAIPAKILREATRKEFLAELKSQGIKLNAATLLDMAEPGYKYYDISID